MLSDFAVVYGLKCPPDSLSPALWFATTSLSCDAVLELTPMLYGSSWPAAGGHHLKMRWSFEATRHNPWAELRNSLHLSVLTSDVDAVGDIVSFFLTSWVQTISEISKIPRCLLIQCQNWQCITRIPYISAPICGAIWQRFIWTLTTMLFIVGSILRANTFSPSLSHLLPISAFPTQALHELFFLIILKCSLFLAFILVIFIISFLFILPLFSFCKLWVDLIFVCSLIFSILQIIFWWLRCILLFLQSLLRHSCRPFLRRLFHA